ncbi:cryptochrome/photolyase family protein, partial [bacterium]|nr:cryptochrome/photolyase family protein [bacterium]
ISKMSNYCSGCRYKPALKTGDQACPLNYLYWNFYSRHAKRFSKNPRVSMAINTWNKKSAEERRAVTQSASAFLTALGR